MHAIYVDGSGVLVNTYDLKRFRCLSHKLIEYRCGQSISISRCKGGQRGFVHENEYS